MYILKEKNGVGMGGETFATATQIILSMTEVILGIEELTKIKLMVLKCSGNHQMVGREITQ